MLEKLFLVGTAYGQAAAEGAAAPKSASLFEILLLPLGFVVIFYFLLIRPQSKRAKEQANLISNLKAGDEVVTTSGIIGKVKSVSDQFVTLESSTSTFKIMKNHIATFTKGKDTATVKG